MKRISIVLVIVGTLGVGAGAYYNSRTSTGPQINTVAIGRGSVAETVAATGTLQAVKTVTVGSQVSGTIATLGADFNSIVHKGSVIATLDPSLLQAQVAQSRASLVKANADAQREQATLSDAQMKYSRAKALFDKQLLASSDLDAAKVALDLAQADLRSVDALVIQAQASLNQAQVNLDHSTITAPIDGIVIERSVDVGQTVAASLSSPTIFVIAADLTKMQVSAAIDEADIGRIRPGQPVTFRVDAYAGQQFTGTVSQVRLQPTVVSNVTTYSAIIDVPNTDLRLRPGMTATVAIEIAKRADTLRIPNAALRFVPTAQTFAALEQEVPADLNQAASTRVAAPAAATTTAAADAARADAAQTFDALFAPLPIRESSARIWTLKDGNLQAVNVRLGVTDGTNTEIIGSPLEAGAAVVTGVVTPSAQAGTKASAAGTTSNPLLGGTRPPAGGR